METRLVSNEFFFQTSHSMDMLFVFLHKLCSCLLWHSNVCNFLSRWTKLIPESRWKYGFWYSCWL